MRFILKCAFLLGLAAFFLPFGQDRSGTGVEISWFGALAGVQEAVQDLSGFCDRAPRACEAGREMALFAGKRVGDGIAIAYDFVGGRGAAPDDADPADPDRPTLADGAFPDPVLTGTVAATQGRPLPHAYVAPRRSAPDDAGSKTAEAAPHRSVVVPTPAPRG